MIPLIVGGACYVLGSWYLYRMVRILQGTCPECHRIDNARRRLK